MSANNNGSRNRQIQIVGNLVEEAEQTACFQQEWGRRARWLNSHATLLTSISAQSFGLTSIVIPTYNQRRFTEMCLQSIRWHTDVAYEIIVVDNGSTDGTPQWLSEQPDVRLISNETNLGFAKASNQGIRLARGEQILLLNNDVVVTPYWLTRLLRALYRQPNVALAGPVSNYVSGSQCIEAVYSTVDELERFVQDNAARHDSQSQDTERLVGFCLLFKRAVTETIGLLDEQFGLGNFEDDDFCRRAVQAGLRSVIALDAFVHHFGSISFRAMPRPLVVEAYKKNRDLFDSKWQAVPQDKLIAPDPAIRRVVRRIENVGGRPNLSLALICRDNERTIRACLESIGPWVDEMIVVDTGSQDRTPQIATELGAQLHYFPWCDDFSAARNESLRHATGDWIFWMDSDDTISEENGRKLRELVSREPGPAVLGYVMQVHCPGAGADRQWDVTVVDHVKLFRNRPDLRFEGRIHEQILASIRRANGEVQWTDIHVTHSGYDHSPAGQVRKRERDLRILHLEYTEQPDHPFTLFNLGMTYADISKHEQAADYLRRSIELSDASASHIRKAYALLIYCLKQLELGDEAWRVCEQAIEQFPNDPEIRFRRALLLQERGSLHEAAEQYEAALVATEPPHFGSVDRGIQGFKTRQNLALLLEEIGNLSAAEDQWRLIVQEIPNYRLAWRGQARLMIRQGRLDEARQLADSLLPRSELRVEGLLLLGEIALQQGKVNDAKRFWEEANPNSDLEVLRLLCRLLFEQGDLPDARHRLQQLIEWTPDDGAALHNLGTVHLQLSNVDEALDFYRRSLTVRPESADTHLYLGYAQHAAGKTLEAIDSWEAALRLAPGFALAEEALARVRSSPASESSAC